MVCLCSQLPKTCNEDAGRDRPLLWLGTPTGAVALAVPTWGPTGAVALTVPAQLTWGPAGAVALAIPARLPVAVLGAGASLHNPADSISSGAGAAEPLWQRTAMRKNQNETSAAFVFLTALFYSTLLLNVFLKFLSPPENFPTVKNNARRRLE